VNASSFARVVESQFTCQVSEHQLTGVTTSFTTASRTVVNLPFIWRNYEDMRMDFQDKNSPQ
jgi:hypothetical protein